MIAHPIANILAIEFKKEKQMTPSFQRAGMLVVLCATDFIRFLTTNSANGANALIDKLTLQKNEIFDPNWKRRQTSLAHAIQLAENYA